MLNIISTTADNNDITSWLHEKSKLEGIVTEILSNVKGEKDIKKDCEWSIKLLPKHELLYHCYQ